MNTESFVYVDKDTGLPVRAEGYGQSSGNVQGVNRGRVVVEMRDINTNVDPSVFELPADYRQLSPDEIKQQMAAVGALFQVLLNGMNAQMNGGNTTTTTTTTNNSAPPATNASPLATASPTP